MGRAGMALTQGLHDELRLGPPLDRLHAGEEAALLDQEFVLDGGLQGVAQTGSGTRKSRLMRPPSSLTRSRNWVR